jgi:hypothetical protein
MGKSNNVVFNSSQPIESQSVRQVIDSTTREYRKLENHVEKSKGRQSVCASTCLSFFGVQPNQYKYTSSKKDRLAYENVLRKNGYTVRNRNKYLGVASYGDTMSSVKESLRASVYTSDDKFLVLVYQSKASHVIVVDGNGKTVVDTAYGKKWRVQSIMEVKAKA